MPVDPNISNPVVATGVGHYLDYIMTLFIVIMGGDRANQYRRYKKSQKNSSYQEGAPNAEERRRMYHDQCEPLMKEMKAELKNEVHESVGKVHSTINKVANDTAYIKGRIEGFLNGGLKKT